MSHDLKYYNILGCVGYSSYNEESSLDQEAEWDKLSLTSHNDMENSWEVLTEVESVLSFDASSVSSVLPRPSSYKEALVREGIADRHKDHTSVRISGTAKKKKKLKLIKENDGESGTEDDEFGFDAIQVMKGIKCGRGGKASQWFKNNKTTIKPLPKIVRISREHDKRQARQHLRKYCSTSNFRNLG